MNRFFDCFASSAFGLEGLVASELREMNIRDVRAENGGVRFSASPEEILLCNLKTHFCDRIYIIAAEGVCTSFEDLFQLVYSVPWQDYTEGSEAFLVSAKCARSRLMSPRDCQSITKKAIIEKIKSKRNQQVFPENGSAFPVQVSVHSDRTKISINTSGEALSRRGYRTWNGEAPLRESLAAALVKLSPWDKNLPLYDPCCGTGTILIEGAFMAANRAPGLRRSFAMDAFHVFRDCPLSRIRQHAAAEYHPDSMPSIAGSDIDPDAVKLANRHINQAEMSDYVRVLTSPLQNLVLSEKKGVFICNPPYGERLGDQKSCRMLYGELRKLKERHPLWSICIISSDPAFERYFGKRADKKRRLYNGRLECTYYVYE